MYPCTQCGIRCGEPDQVCTFCRVRTRWWTTVDSLPLGLRGWGISNIRIWTGIVQEELDRFGEAEKARAAATATAASKSASPVVRGETPTKGSKESEADRPDKSWIAPKKEGDKPNTPKETPGVEEVASPVEEGKFSSGSKQPQRRQDSQEKEQEHEEARQVKEQKITSQKEEKLIEKVKAHKRGQGQEEGTGR